jgi:hypothetical protein
VRHQPDLFSFSLRFYSIATALVKSTRTEGVIWYLLYSPVTQNNDPDFYFALSQWHIDGFYGSAADCAAAHRSDLSALQGRILKSRPSTDSKSLCGLRTKREGRVDPVTILCSCVEFGYGCIIDNWL